MVFYSDSNRVLRDGGFVYLHKPSNNLLVTEGSSVDWSSAEVINPK
jgi:hypothetical protein